MTDDAGRIRLATDGLPPAQEVLAPRESLPIKEAVGLYLYELQEVYAASALSRYGRELMHFCRYAERYGLEETADLEASDFADFLGVFYAQERLFEQAAAARDVLSATKQWMKWLKRRKLSNVYDDWRGVRRQVKADFKLAVREARLRRPVESSTGQGDIGR